MIKYTVRQGKVVKVYEDGKYEFLTFDDFTEKQAQSIADILNSETTNPNGTWQDESETAISHDYNVAQHLVSLAGQLYLEEASAESDEEFVQEVCNELFSTIEEWQPEAMGQEWEYNIPLVIKNRPRGKKLTLTLIIETDPY